MAMIGTGAVAGAAHEWGHTYNLCDEYSSEMYTRENEGYAGGCRNHFAPCPPELDFIKQCPGNTNVYRNYAGPVITTVCGVLEEREGLTRAGGGVTGNYSVMGSSGGHECGFPDPGYLAVGGYIGAKEKITIVDKILNKAEEWFEDVGDLF